MKLAHPMSTTPAIALLAFILTGCATRDAELNSAHARLLYAAEHNDVRLAERILAEDPFSVTATDEDGETVLDHLARWASVEDPASLEILQHLLDAGADPDAGRPTDVYILTRTGDPAALEMILKAGVSQFKLDYALIMTQFERAQYVKGFRDRRWDDRDETSGSGDTLESGKPSILRPGSFGPSPLTPGSFGPSDSFEEEQRQELDMRISLLRKYGAGSDPHSAIWQPATGKSRHRMVCRWGRGPRILWGGGLVKKWHLIFNTPHYDMDQVTVWEKEGKQYLVVIPAPYGRGREGTGVLVFDKQLKLARVGWPGTDSIHFYALVEMRSSNESLPPEVRGQWMLGLAERGWRSKVDLSKPVRFACPRNPDESRESPQPNTLYCYPIDWFDDDLAVDDGFRFESGEEPLQLKGCPPEKRIRLKDLADAEIRIAEPNHPFDR